MTYSICPINICGELEWTSGTALRPPVAQLRYQSRSGALDAGRCSTRRVCALRRGWGSTGAFPPRWHYALVPPSLSAGERGVPQPHVLLPAAPTAALLAVFRESLPVLQGAAGKAPEY